MNHVWTRKKFMIVAAVIGVCSIFYFYWCQDSVIANTQKGDITFKIREIPLGLTSGTYLYRCEVWWRGTMIKCNVYGDSSYITDFAKIDVDDKWNVSFKLRDRNIPFYFGGVWQNSAWTEGHE